MLAMGAIFVEPELAAKITDIFLNTPFSEGERHQRRVNEIDQDI